MSDEAMTENVSAEERARRRQQANHRRTQAIGVADEVLRTVWRAIKAHRDGSGENRIDGDESYLLSEIKRARGEIAEWRPESD